MTPDEFKKIGEASCVSNAAGHDCLWQGRFLEPQLWEALRIELQRRFRRSTGETMAVLSIELTPADLDTSDADANGGITVDHIRQVREGRS